MKCETQLDVIRCPYHQKKIYFVLRDRVRHSRKGFDSGPHLDYFLKITEFCSISRKPPFGDKGVLDPCSLRQNTWDSNNSGFNWGK